MTDRAKKILDDLQLRDESGLLPHAFLVSGGDRKSREDFALRFAENLFSDDPLAAVKIAGNNFEDIFYIRPDGDSIKVLQIEELIRNLRNKPFSHSRMMAIISDADAMTPQSQNKLLKTLEEPAPGNVILLLAENPEALFLTIRSRLLPLSIPSISAGGDPEMLEDAKQLVSMALNKKKAISEAFLKAESFADDRDSAEALMDAISWFLRDIIVGGFSVGLVTNEQNAEIATKMVGRASLLSRFITLTENARTDMQRGINRKSCLKDMLLKMRMEVESE